MPFFTIPGILAGELAAFAVQLCRLLLKILAVHILLACSSTFAEAGVQLANDDPVAAASPSVQWLQLEDGLDFHEFRPGGSGAKITVLRIVPEKFDFILKSAGEDGSVPKTLAEWAEEGGLAAAINASMYLPDGKTSTGYLRQKDYVNNPRIVGRFGAFFVAQPRRPGLPAARIVDKDESGWKEVLEDYDLVIQNYRMTNSSRKILWSPGGPLYAISAVAQDGDGRILFLHSSVPMEAYNFVQQILHLPLDARTIMYVEGGAQAGMVVHSSGLKRDLGLPHAPSFLVTGKLKAALPNILGIRARSLEHPDPSPGGQPE